MVDRRRIELIEPGLSPAPIHYESRRLDVAATAALVAEVRASVVRAASAALDEIASALPAPVLSISLRAWPPDFPEDKWVPREQFTTGLEVRTRIRCGNHAVGYSFGHGVWEWFYEKVVFFF